MHEADVVIQSFSCDGNIKKQEINKFASCSPAKYFLPLYIWSPTPSVKGENLELSFSVDIPTLVLFVIALSMTVALLKLYTRLGSQLSLDLESEEPVLLPTR